MKIKRTIQQNLIYKKNKIPKSKLQNQNINKYIANYKDFKTQNGGAAKAASTISQYESEKRMFSDVLAMPVVGTIQSVHALISKIFNGDNIKYFKLDGSMPDPFIKLADRDDFIPSFYLDWYMSKNPEFKTHAEMKLENTDFNTNIGLDGKGDSIYETTIAQICRDILIMIYTSKRNMNNNARNSKVLEKHLKERLNTRKGDVESLNPELQQNIDKIKEIQQNIANLEESKKVLSKPATNLSNNNKTKINSLKNLYELQTEKDLEIDDPKKQLLFELLHCCNNCIEIGYKYRDVFNIIYRYVFWLSYNRKIKNGVIDFNEASQYFIESEKLFFNSHYIIFPTYTQISYKYVLYLMCSPIINFRLINRARNIHHVAGPSIIDWYHDIAFHGNYTHQIRLLSQKYSTDKDIYLKWFSNMSSILSILYPYYNYTQLTINKKINSDKIYTYDELEDDKKKQIIAILLFIFFHEGIFENIFYHLYFQTVETVKYGRFSYLNLDIICKRIMVHDDWPKYIDVKSIINALNFIFNNNREEFNKQMRILGEILDLRLPQLQSQ